jgi:hypothetical protein
MADRLDEIKATVPVTYSGDERNEVDWLISELEQARQRIAELERGLRESNEALRVAAEEYEVATVPKMPARSDMTDDQRHTAHEWIDEWRDAAIRGMKEPSDG